MKGCSVAVLCASSWASSCSSPSDVEEMKGCSCASPPKLCSDLKVKLEVNAGQPPQRERPNDKQALILIPSSSYCNHHNHHHNHNHNHHHHCHHSHIVIIGRIIEQPSGWMGHMSSIWTHKGFSRPAADSTAPQTNWRQVLIGNRRPFGSAIINYRWWAKVNIL